MLSRLGARIVALSLVAGPAAAQSPELALEGKVRQPQHWTLEDLKKMPAEHVDVSYQTDRGPVRGSFTGVLLWSLIGAAGGIDDSAKMTAAQTRAGPHARSHEPTSGTLPPVPARPQGRFLCRMM